MWCGGEISDCSGRLFLWNSMCINCWCSWLESVLFSECLGSEEPKVVELNDVPILELMGLHVLFVDGGEDGNVTSSAIS